MRGRRLGLPIVLALLVGCTTPARVTPRNTPARPAAPAANVLAVPQVGAPTTLTGKVKLITDAGGSLIGNNGGNLISDHGGGIISDHAAGIISNNGGGIISDHAAGLTSKVKRQLLADPPALATYLLADAHITLLDAKGRTLADANGKAIAADSDRQGSYTFKAVLPKGNLVARIQLWNGGELSALVVPDGDSLTLDLDVASTLGASYVMRQYVKGDQAVFDRLPRPEADRLRQELDVVRGYLAAAPGYKPADMVAATDALRAKVPAVDRTLEDVKALLLGQAKLGAGRPATEVPLADPRGLVVDARGRLLLGEFFQGRVRIVERDGTLTTLADVSSTRVKRNFLKLTDMAIAPDGTLYISSFGTHTIHRITPADEVSIVVGGAGPREPIAGPLETAILPLTLALAPDGTLYIGEHAGGPKELPRLLAFDPVKNSLRAIPLAPDVQAGDFAGLDVGADGTVYALFARGKQGSSIYRIRDGVAALVETPALGGDASALVCGADGTLYVSFRQGGNILALAPDGTQRTVTGEGTPDLTQPESLALGPDGTLYVAEASTSLVQALRPDGRWQVVAGTQSRIDEGETTSFAINQPIAVTFGEDGALYVVEAGSSRVRRFKDGKLEPYAGTTSGFGGDGGPAAQAQLSFPIAIDRQGGDVWVGENSGERIRHIDPAGTIETVVGGGKTSLGEVQPGTRRPAAGAKIPQVIGMAVDERRRVYWTTSAGHQLLRFTPGDDGGSVEVLAGKFRPDTGLALNPLEYLTNDETDPAGVLGFPAGLAFAPNGDLYMTQLVACSVTRVTGLEGDGPPRLERVAGRTIPGMLAAATEVKEDFNPFIQNGIPATQAPLFLPTAVAFDAAGTMYVAEAGTLHLGSLVDVLGAAGSFLGSFKPEMLGLPASPGRIRKITADGTVTTIAGRRTRFFPDDTGDNALVFPFALAVAPDGRLAIADVGANMVRILPAGSY